MSVLELENGAKTHHGDLASLVVAYHNRVHGGLAKWCDQDMCAVAAQVADFVDWFTDVGPDCD